MSAWRQTLADGSRLGFVGALTVAVAGALWMMVLRSKPTSHTAGPIAEVPRGELVLKDGRLYRTGFADPFTGVMAEKYASGALKSRSMVSNGLLHGRSEGWHTNGLIQVVEHFKAGVSHGHRAKYYPNGARMSEVTVVEGQLHGRFRRWYEEGALAEQVALSDSQPHGTSLACYPSGFLKTKATLQHGKIIQLESWKDGETKASIVDDEPGQ